MEVPAVAGAVAEAAADVGVDDTDGIERSFGPRLATSTRGGNSVEPGPK